MGRTFKHAVTGRSIRVREDSTVERLVEADENWSEDKPEKKSTSSKEADDGSGNSGGRRGRSRKKSDDGGS